MKLRLESRAVTRPRKRVNSTLLLFVTSQTKPPVRNPTLSAALARLGSRHEQVAGIRGLIGDLDIKTAAVLGEVELTYDASGNPDIGPEALRSFRADPRVRGAASAKFRFVKGYLGILQELEDTIDEILVLIRDTVGD